MASTKGTYQEKFPEKLLSALTYFHREYAAPIDDTSVWNTMEDLQAYLDMPGSYAYPGQIVAVANGGMDAADDTEFSIYLVRADKSLQPMSSTKNFNSAAEVEANIDKMATGTIISVWNEELERHELFTVENSTKGEGKKELQRQSFNPEDIPDLEWSKLKNRPESTVTDIDAAVTFSKRFAESEVTDPENPDAAGEPIISYKSKQLAFVSDIPTTYDAAKVIGVLSLDNIPHGALERCVVVADDDAKDLLTPTDVQPGDTVKVESTKQMYFVKSITDEGALVFEDYTATAASSVPWSGVTNKPTTLDGFGITDAVNSSEIVDTATAGKVLRLDENGKLPADITGDAATLGGHAETYFATDADLDALAERMDAAETTINTATSNITGLTSQQETNTTAIKAIQNQLPGLLDGSNITTFDVSKLDGVIDRSHLPVDVSGMGLTVDDKPSRLALTNTTVHNGWIIKQTDTTALYLVVDDTKLDQDAGYMLLIENSSIKVDWDNVENKPTTAEDLGLTDVVLKTDTAETATANKIPVLGSDAKLHADITGSAEKLGDQLPAYYAKASDLTTLSGRVDTHDTDIAGLKDGSLITALAATKLTGTINIDNLPHGALERCVVVADDTARMALTSANVQAGDTVKVRSTNKMYFVIDDTKLNSEDGYEIYTAGVASAVAWSGVTDKPTTVDGFGITDAVKTTDLTDTGGASSAGKVPKLNSDGKLGFDLAGNVPWANITDKPTSTVTQIDQAVTDSVHTNRAMLDKISETKITYSSSPAMGGNNAYDWSTLWEKALGGFSGLTYESTKIASINQTAIIAKAAAAHTIHYDDVAPIDAPVGTFWLEPITGVS